MAYNPTAKQIISKKVLDRLYKQSEFFSTDDDNIDLDRLLQTINEELTPPFPMSESSPADLVLNIGAISKTNTETDITHITPPISGLLPNFTGATVTFPSTSGGNAVPSAGDSLAINITAGNFLKVGISVDATGDIVLQTGVEGATEAAATAPPLASGTHAVGYVVLQNIAGTIQNIENTRIYQYVGGGAGGSGTGDASGVVTRLQDMFEDSVFNLLNAVDFALDTDNQVNGASTGEYSLVSNTFELELDASGSITSVDTSPGWVQDVDVLMDTDLSRTSAQSFVPTSSGDLDQMDVLLIGTGGLTAGNFTVDIYSDSAGLPNALIGSSDAIAFGSLIDGVNSFNFSTPIALSSGTTYHMVIGYTGASGTLSLRADSTNPYSNGNVSFFNGSTWSTQATRDANIQAFYNGVPVGETLVTTNLLSTDEFTALSKVIGKINVVVIWDESKIDDAAVYEVSLDGSNWNTITMERVGEASDAFVGSYEFSETTATGNLQLRVTASQTDVAIKGYGLFYDVGGVVAQGEKLTKSFNFLSNTDNLDTFDLGWIPDTDLLEVYHIQTGQVYKFPAFSVSGTNIVFPADTFEQASDESVTLFAIQTKGTSFDNSDSNAALLADNGLGSLDGTIDKSVAGKGIKQRTPNGTLVEIRVNDDFEIEIYEVTP